MRFEDKVAVVTGAASGIGAASARQLAADGARVVLADVDEAGIEELAGSIGDAAVWVKTDVSNPEDNEPMVQTALETWGRLDLVHLNAGVAGYGGLFDCSIEDWDRHMAINLRGVFLGLKASAFALAEGGGGAILVTASTAGRRGSPGTLAYTATKHGVIGLVKASSIDLAPRNIRINAICPGITDTPILGPLHDSEEGRRILGPLQVMGRIGHPEEIAKVASFLLSDEASFMTAETVTVDGGGVSLINLSLSTDFVKSLAD